MTSQPRPIGPRREASRSGVVLAGWPGLGHNPSAVRGVTLFVCLIVLAALGAVGAAGSGVAPVVVFQGIAGRCAAYPTVEERVGAAATSFWRLRPTVSPDWIGEFRVRRGEALRIKAWSPENRVAARLRMTRLTIQYGHRRIVFARGDPKVWRVPQGGRYVIYVSAQYDYVDLAGNERAFHVGGFVRLTTHPRAPRCVLPALLRPPHTSPPPPAVEP